MNTVIVTGLSGAGKTQAMNCLEDLGYYCVDNMPPALIKSFVQLAAGESTPIEKAAFAVDVRGGELFADMEKALEDLEASVLSPLARGCCLLVSLYLRISTSSEASRYKIL